MLAKPIAGLPDSAEGLAFQPKWDGFRVIIYRRGDDVVIQGRMRAADAAATGSWDLSYAFPEMVERIRGMRADDVVLDGELVVIRDGRLAFDALQGRLRPRKEEGGWKIAQLAGGLPDVVRGVRHPRPRRPGPARGPLRRPARCPRVGDGR